MIAQLTYVHENDAIVGLAAAVQRRLTNRLRGFRLVVQSKGLILHGQTASYHAKQLAQHAIMEATEMPIVANEIEVLPRQLQSC